MACQAFHDVNDTETTGVRRQAIEQEAKAECAQDWQDHSKFEAQCLGTVGGLAMQQPRDPFDGSPEQQHDDACNQADGYRQNR